MNVMKTLYGSLFGCSHCLNTWFKSLDEHDRHVEAVHGVKNR